MDVVVRESHQIAVRADILTSGVVVRSVVLAAGSVAVDRSQMVRRTCDVTVNDPTLAPRYNTDLLQPYGNEIRLWRGVLYPDASTPELVPVFTGPIQTTDWDDPAALFEILGSDRMQRIVDDRFWIPRTVSGSSVVNEITSLLLETIPYVDVVVAAGVVDSAFPQVTWNTDRGQAVTDLATSIGCEVFADPMGTFIIQPIPSPTGTPVWHVNVGPTGVMTKARRSTDRTNLFNAIMANGQSVGSGVAPTSGTLPSGDPVCADYDPTSPTYWYGTFGRKVGFLSSTVASLLTTVGQCIIAGNAALRNYTGEARSVDFQAIVHPALEEGDIIELDYLDGSVEQHILDSLTIPLTADATMTGSTRAGTNQAAVT